ncbi:MAG: biotin transporter BioY [Clostridia bacterium]|nr:biotin transporter BioY [Clostridia bacterium]
MKNRKTVFIGVMAAVISAVSVWQIPLPFGVPFTFQVLAVALSGYVLGAGGGSIAVCVYLALGAVGAPVFSGFAGGVATLAGPTGGFLLGFLPLCALCGVGRNKGSLAGLLFGALGLIFCHLTGVAYYMIATGSSLLASLLSVSLPYLPKDMILVAAAYFASIPIRKAT